MVKLPQLIFLEDFLTENEFNLGVKFRVRHVENHLSLVGDDFSSTEVICTKLKWHFDDVLLKKFQNLKYIVCPTTGIDHLNPTFCSNKKIQIISLNPHEISHIKSTTEVTLWHILNLTRHLSEYVSQVKNNQWNRYALTCNSMSSLTIGILGYGRIGSQVTLIMKNLGAKVLVYDEDETKTIKLRSDEVVNNPNLLFEKCDLVTIHVTGLESNRHLVNGNLFKLIKSNPFWLVNTSRGFIVNEEDLVEAMNAGRINGYGGDVLSNERSNSSDWLNENPLQQNNLDFSKKTYITPHVGGATVDGIMSTERIVLRKLLNEIEILDC